MLDDAFGATCAQVGGMGNGGPFVAEVPSTVNAKWGSPTSRSSRLAPASTLAEDVGVAYLPSFGDEDGDTQPRVDSLRVAGLHALPALVCELLEELRGANDVLVLERLILKEAADRRLETTFHAEVIGSEWTPRACASCLCVTRVFVQSVPFYFAHEAARGACCTV